MGSGSLEEVERVSVRPHWFVWSLGLGHAHSLWHSWLACVFLGSAQICVQCVVSYCEFFDALISVLCRIFKCVSNPEGSQYQGASTLVIDVNTDEMSLETS